MDIFDKIGKTATETYKYTAEKTGKFARITKLKMTINEKKCKIDDLYEEIGKKVYEKHIREENIEIDEDLKGLCAQIDELSNQIEQARMEILRLNEKKQCSKCFAEIEINYSFCPSCGEKQKEDEPAREVEIVNNLEKSEIKPENETEAEIVEQEKMDDE